ncbi:MAG: hypothetical protein Q4G34_05275 [Micrococcus sp.]|nr:hypothetical protein [Micrococcus sp.]
MYTHQPAHSRGLAPDDVWQLPTLGSSWTRTGAELTEDDALSLAEDLFGVIPDSLTHHQVILVTMEAWQYLSVCDFFLDALCESALQVHGGAADHYPLREALAVTGYFSRRWNGCPEEICLGGYAAEGYPESEADAAPLRPREQGAGDDLT